MMRAVPFALVAALALGTALPAAAQDAEAGKRVFNQCRACHSIEAGGRNGVGPNLHGIIGRKAGIVEGFRYSANLKEKAEAGLAWDEATLRAYVTNPKALLPAGSMSYPGLKNEQSLNDLLAFLKTQGYAGRRPVGPSPPGPGGAQASAGCECPCMTQAASAALDYMARAVLAIRQPDVPRAGGSGSRAMQGRLTKPVRGSDEPLAMVAADGCRMPYLRWPAHGSLDALPAGVPHCHRPPASHAGIDVTRYGGVVFTNERRSAVGRCYCSGPHCLD